LALCARRPAFFAGEVQERYFEAMDLTP